MSTPTKGKDDANVEMVENSRMSKAEEHDFIEAEKQMTLWQAAKAHKRILLYCKATNQCSAVIMFHPYGCELGPLD